MSERLASTHRKGNFTDSHISALSILSENHVRYLAEEVIQCFGEFDSEGRPVSYKADILINDPQFGSGVIEIDGRIHHRGNHPAEDERRDKRLKKLGLWVEHIENESTGGIMSVLERHRAKVDAFGGRSP